MSLYDDDERSYFRLKLLIQVSSQKYSKISVLSLAEAIKLNSRLLETSDCVLSFQAVKEPS